MSISSDIIFYTPIVFVLLYLLVNYFLSTPRNVCIVVLGDLGRSPRMQYHALSFAKEGFRVYLVGYKGTTPHRDVLQNDNIQIFHVQKPPAFFEKLPRICGYFLKVIWQSFFLTSCLLLLPNMCAMLIQNPPSIPTMLVCYVVSKIRFCNLVTDWHNYGYTILALALNPEHPLVRLAKRYEMKCGRLSSRNICVTRAMKQDLETNWQVRAITVYDRPAELFQPSDLSQQHELFTRLAVEFPAFRSSEPMSGNTRFTRLKDDGSVVRSSNSTAILISSTSWTEDEDFSILLEALVEYDKESTAVDGVSPLPDLVCVITGKGPQKNYYTKKIEERSWKKITFCLPWLAAEDYPVMLGSADIGVCLHKSSSGLDLPMKVVDMFGCGLPVCALKFKCIEELLQHDKNGLIFSDSQELVQQLKDLLQGFPNKNDRLVQFRQNLASLQAARWHEQWKKLVQPIFSSESSSKPSFTVPDLFGGEDTWEVLDDKKDR